MFLANFKNSFSNFLARRLQRWADFLRQHNQAANLKKANPPEPPENSSPHEDWFQKTASKPPQDWFERVSRDAPQLLTEMPEFTIQTMGASESNTLIATAKIEANEFQTDRRKNVHLVKRETVREVQQKPESTQPLPNSANKTNPKQRLFSVNFFARRASSNHQNEVIPNVSIDSNNATDLTFKNKVQTDSTVARGKSLPHNLPQTSIAKFERRETESVSESDSIDFKIGRASINGSPLQLEQTGNYRSIKFRPKTVSDVGQKRVLRSKSKNQENKSDKVISPNIAATKAPQTRLNNFVMPPQNVSDHKKTSESRLLTKRNQPITSNILPPKSEKFADDNLSAALFPSQENQWADLPQSVEDTSEYELFEREKRRLRRIEAEQMGGGWNE